MKTQITSILLCALLSSTLGHEYLSARHFAHEARSSKYLSHLSQARNASPPQQCEWLCNHPTSNSSSGGGLEIIVNETTNLVGVVNVTASVALVIDINANLVALFNGTSGAVIVVNIQTGSGVYIAAGQSTSVWLSGKESFEVYFSSLKSLQVILDLKVGTSFNRSSITSAILEVLGNLLVHLSHQLELELQGNVKAALTILLKISSSLITVLKGPLEGILGLFGKGLISIHGDILWLVSVLEGLGDFLGEVTGGLAALLKAKVKLDIALLLGAANGVDLLVNLLLAIVARVDLSIVASLLNSTEKLLNLIVKLGGNLSVGFNGVYKVIAQIIALIKGHLEIDVLINTLLEFVASKSEDIDISISVEGLRKVVEIQVSLHSSEHLSGFITFINNSLNKKLIIGAINLVELADILIEGAVDGGLHLVVNILQKLSSVIKPEVAISSLLLNLLLHLNSTAGIHVLQAIIPDLSIDVNISIGGNIIEQILSKVNIKTILSLLTGSSIEAVLKALPVVGSIIEALAKAVNISSNGSLNLSVILKSSGASSIVSKLKDWVKSCLSSEHSGGVTSPPISLPTLPSIGGIFGWSSRSNGSASGSSGSASGSSGSDSGSGGSASGSSGSDSGSSGSASGSGGSASGHSGSASGSSGSDSGSSGSDSGSSGSDSGSSGSAGGSGEWNIGGSSGSASGSSGSAGGSGQWSIGGSGGSASGSSGSAGGSGQWSIGGSGGAASGSSGSAGGSGHWGIGGHHQHNEKHGHLRHEKSGHLHSHKNHPEEKKHHGVH